MRVTIKPHHLRGNSWAHRDNGRFCPLQEALVEAGHKEVFVFADTVDIGIDTFEIPIDKWDEEIVEGLIKEANEGSEKEIEIELICIL